MVELSHTAKQTNISSTNIIELIHHVHLVERLVFSGVRSISFFPAHSL